MSIDYEKLKKEMMKGNGKYSLKIDEYENKIISLYKDKKYKEALDLSKNMLEQMTLDKIEDDELVYFIFIKLRLTG